jgi:hypothetical protein
MILTAEKMMKKEINILKNTSKKSKLDCLCFTDQGEDHIAL